MPYIQEANEYIFENRYGRVVFVPVSPVRSVRVVRAADVADEYRFDLDTAERITLITRNESCQIAFTSWNPEARGIIVLHMSADMVQVCRIAELDYKGPDATANEIAELNRVNGWAKL